MGHFFFVLVSILAFTIHEWDSLSVSGATLASFPSTESAPDTSIALLANITSNSTSTNGTEDSQAPSLIPSAAPTPLPTNATLPTNGTSEADTAEPTFMPTFSPTTNDTIPSALPTEQPSSPTSEPTSTPTTEPNAQSTDEPTAQPTAQPSSAPSSLPSAQPTAEPTSSPTSRPSSRPSSLPTSMPSPGGSAGLKWWYVVSAEATLDMDGSAHSQSKIEQALVYSFTFVLTEKLGETKRSAVTVAATPMDRRRLREVVDTPSKLSSHTPTPTYTILSGLGRLPVVDMSPVASASAITTTATETETAKYQYRMQAWCGDHETLSAVHDAMLNAARVPQSVIEPLHEQGIYEAANLTISSISVATSTSPPPFDANSSPLSPVRITYIILGTLLLFSLGLFLIANLKNFHHCGRICTSEFKIYCEDTARSVYHTLADASLMCLRRMGVVSSELRSYYGSGFDLSTQDEEADFYGENGNLPSDNLNIHYNRNQRSKYLEDDDEEKDKQAGTIARPPRTFGRPARSSVEMGTFANAPSNSSANTPREG
eukprot:CAMPEP_0173350674 /NCGR_PEP_ID=MMETSP1144-20121109/15037_1 /TAXON_ID=483371 /ORGANISM="non described non described, Strain CCMP2298" /LENGTH=542 /DNA_ID=CAMNT_0014298691 /DNA_START=79 /DNA_END=1703 /DNA_ORIENTATION=-